MHRSGAKRKPGAQTKNPAGAGFLRMAKTPAGVGQLFARSAHALVLAPKSATLSSVSFTLRSTSAAKLRWA